MNSNVASLRLPQPFAALPWPPRIDWRRGLAQGWVLGLLPLAVDLPLPTMISTLGISGALQYLSRELLMGTFRGLVWAWTAQWVEGRLTWPAMAVLVVAETALLVVLSVGVRDSIGGPSRDYIHNASFMMLFWLQLVYGSVFFAYCLATQRALRVRGVLARAELERERSATALNEARIDALAARIDPTLLLRVLTAAKRAYARRSDGADTLLDALVTFLRLAMPAVRRGKSTLLSELALLRAYAALLTQLEPGSTMCSVEAVTPPCDIAFPPLLLIPLVESAAAQGRHAPHVALTAHDGGLMLTLEASTAAGWMDETTKQRLERALHGLFTSPEARFEVGASPSLVLWLPLSPASEEVSHEFATV